MNAPAFGKAGKIAGWLFVGACCAAYAVLAHRAASAPRPGAFEALVVCVPLLAVGLALACRSARRGLWLAVWLGAAAAILLAGRSMPTGTLWLLLFESVGINLAMALAFGRTLATGSTPLVSRFAQVVHGALSPRLARYTRGVTLAWVLYFVSTSVISVVLFFTAEPAVWSAFVNLLSLPLLAAMFVGEYVVRMVLIPASERTGFFQAVAAYRKFSAAKAGRAQ